MVHPSDSIINMSPFWGLCCMYMWGICKEWPQDFTHSQTGRQIDRDRWLLERQLARQTAWQAGRQTDRQLYRQTAWQTAGQRDSWTDGLTERYRWTDSETTICTYTDKTEMDRERQAGRYMHGRTSCTGRALGTDSGSLTDLSLLSSDESFWSRLTRSSNSATFWHRSELKRSLTFGKESRPLSLWHSHCVEDWPFIGEKSELIQNFIHKTVPT